MRGRRFALFLHAACAARVGALELLPACTVVVAGANGRVGSMVVRELLRTQPKVQVRALVRSATRLEGYARLSYEVGAEDAKLNIRPAWALSDEGGLAWETESEFDEDVQGGYGLDRLSIVECELRYQPDVEAALDGATSVVFCASDFDSSRRRIPERLDNAVRGVAQAGMNLFELRLPGFGRGAEAAEDGDAAARREAVQGKAVDDHGLGVMLDVFGEQRRRRERLGMLTGTAPAAQSAAEDETPTQFVLASASAALGYEESWGEAQESEFGFRKRCAEARLRAEGQVEGGLSHVIVRAARLDDFRLEEGLPLLTNPGVIAEEIGGEIGGKGEGAAGVVQKELRENRIHPRDFAQALVAALLEPVESRGATREVWTASGP